MSAFSNGGGGINTSDNDTMMGDSTSQTSQNPVTALIPSHNNSTISTSAVNSTSITANQQLQQNQLIFLQAKLSELQVLLDSKESLLNKVTADYTAVYNKLLHTTNALSNQATIAKQREYDLKRAHHDNNNLLLVINKVEECYNSMLGLNTPGHTLHVPKGMLTHTTSTPNTIQVQNQKVHKLLNYITQYYIKQRQYQQQLNLTPSSEFDKLVGSDENQLLLTYNTTSQGTHNLMVLDSTISHNNITYLANKVTLLEKQLQNKDILTTELIDKLATLQINNKEMLYDINIQLNTEIYTKNKLYTEYKKVLLLNENNNTLFSQVNDRYSDLSVNYDTLLRKYHEIEQKEQRLEDSNVSLLLQVDVLSKQLSSSSGRCSELDRQLLTTNHDHVILQQQYGYINHIYTKIKSNYFYLKHKYFMLLIYFYQTIPLMYSARNAIGTDGMESESASQQKNDIIQFYMSQIERIEHRGVSGGSDGAVNDDVDNQFENNLTDAPQKTPNFIMNYVSMEQLKQLYSTFTKKEGISPQNGEKMGENDDINDTILLSNVYDNNILDYLQKFIMNHYQASVQSLSPEERENSIQILETGMILIPKSILPASFTTDYDSNSFAHEDSPINDTDLIDIKSPQINKPNAIETNIIISIPMLYQQYLSILHQYDSLNQTHYTTKQQLHSLTTKLTQTIADLNSKHRKVKQQEMVEYQANLEQLHTEIARYKAELEVVKKDKLLLAQQLQHVIKSRTSQSSSSATDELYAKLQQITHEYNQLNGEYQILQKKNESQGLQLIVVKNDYNALSEKYDALEGKFINAQQQLSAQQLSNDKTFVDLNTTLSHNREENEQVRRYQQENTELLQKIAEYEALLTKQSEYINTLNQKNNALEITSNTAQIELTHTKHELELISAKNTEIITAYEAVLAEKMELKSHNSYLSSTNEALSAEKSRLQTESTNFSSLYNDLLTNTHMKLQNEYNAVKNELNLLKTEQKYNTINHENNAAVISALQADLQLAKTKETELNNSYQSKISGLLSKIESLTDQREQLLLQQSSLFSTPLEMESDDEAYNVQKVRKDSLTDETMDNKSEFDQNSEQGSLDITTHSHLLSHTATPYTPTRSQLASVKKSIKKQPRRTNMDSSILTTPQSTQTSQYRTEFIALKEQLKQIEAENGELKKKIDIIQQNYDKFKATSANDKLALVNQKLLLEQSVLTLTREKEGLDKIILELKEKIQNIIYTRLLQAGIVTSNETSPNKTHEKIADNSQNSFSNGNSTLSLLESNDTTTTESTTLPPNNIVNIEYSRLEQLLTNNLNFRQLNAQLETLREEHSALAAAHSELNATHNSLKQTLSTLQSQYNDLSSQLEQKNTKISQLVQSNTTLTEQLTTSETTLNELKVSHTTLLTRNTTLQQDHEKLTKEAAEMFQTLTTLKQSTETAQLTFDTRIVAMSNEIADATAKYLKSIRENEKLNATINTLNNTIISSNQRQSELLQQINVIQTDLDMKSTQVHELEEKLGDLQEKYDAVSQMTTESPTMTDFDSEGLDSELSSLIGSQNATVLPNIKVLQRELQTYQLRVNSLQADKDALIGQISDLQLANQQTQSLYQQQADAMNPIEEQNRVYIEQIKDLSSKLTEMTHQYSELTAEARGVESKLRSLEGLYGELTTKYEQILVENEQLQKNQKITPNNQNGDEVCSECTTLKLTINSKDNIIKQRTAQISQLQSSYKALMQAKYILPYDSFADGTVITPYKTDLKTSDDAKTEKEEKTKLGEKHVSFVVKMIQAEAEGGIQSSSSILSANQATKSQLQQTLREISQQRQVVVKILEKITSAAATTAAQKDMLQAEHVKAMSVLQAQLNDLQEELKQQEHALSLQKAELGEISQQKSALLAQNEGLILQQQKQFQEHQKDNNSNDKQTETATTLQTLEENQHIIDNTEANEQLEQLENKQLSTAPTEILEVIHDESPLDTEMCDDDQENGENVNIYENQHGIKRKSLSTPVTPPQMTGDDVSTHSEHVEFLSSLDDIDERLTKKRCFDEESDENLVKLGDDFMVVDQFGDDSQTNQNESVSLGITPTEVLPPHEDSTDNDDLTSITSENCETIDSFDTSSQLESDINSINEENFDQMGDKIEENLSENDNSMVDDQEVAMFAVLTIIEENSEDIGEQDENQLLEQNLRMDDDITITEEQSQRDDEEDGDEIFENSEEITENQGEITRQINENTENILQIEEIIEETHKNTENTVQIEESAENTPTIEETTADVMDLNYMYRDDEGVEQSDQEALNLLKKAAEQGDVVVQYNLGMMYRNGQGVEQSDQEAFNWLKKAAEQGDAVQFDDEVTSVTPMVEEPLTPTQETTSVEQLDEEPLEIVVSTAQQDQNDFDISQIPPSEDNIENIPQNVDENTEDEDITQIDQNQPHLVIEEVEEETTMIDEEVNQPQQGEQPQDTPQIQQDMSNDEENVAIF